MGIGVERQWIPHLLDWELRRHYIGQTQKVAEQALFLVTWIKKTLEEFLAAASEEEQCGWGGEEMAALTSRIQLPDSLNRVGI